MPGGVNMRILPQVEEFRDEEGSISLLVIGLFLIVLMLSLVILDTAGNMLAKQRLTQIGEAAISTAAHSIDLERYYASDRISIGPTARGSIFRVPISCTDAYAKVQRAISSQNLRGVKIEVVEWNCVDDALAAQIQAEVPLLVQLPFDSTFLPGTEANSSSKVPLAVIQATVKAQSLVSESLP